MLTGLPLPRFPDGRLVLAVDVSSWLRSDAPCSPDRLFCHVYGRAKTASRFIPGWPYSFVAVLEMGATSWTQILDAVRLGPADDATAVTAAQLRDVVERLIAAGQWSPGEPDITVVTDAGYDVTRLAWVLRDLPVELVGRVRGDRVMRLPKPPRVYDPKGGRPPKHGPEFRFAKPETWPEPAVTTRTATMNYGKATAQAWDRVHPRLTHRAAWLDHEGELPLIEGTLVRLEVEHLSKDRAAPAVWVVLEDRRRRRGRRPDLAGVPAALRPGAHLPLVQADPGLDPAPAAGTGGGGPVDLADHRRLHPAPARASGRSRPATSLGKAHRTAPAHPGPGPADVSELPPALALPRQSTETPPARPRTTTRHPEQTPGTPLRRGQNRPPRDNP